MPRPVNPAVRESLLNAGVELIHHRGYNGCGVKDITAAANVPKGSFYNYFPSKEAFVVAAVEEYWDSVETTFGSILLDTSLEPLERVTGFFRAMTDDYETRGFTLGCLLGNMSLELADGSSEARDKLSELFGRWERALAASLYEAQVSGDVPTDRDIPELAATLIEAWEGAVMRGKVDQRRDAYRRFDTVVVPRLMS
jgi:TetR/AcrR family transcriptional regulator, transcriptional repressor for nem operon